MQTATLDRIRIAGCETFVSRYGAGRPLLYLPGSSGSEKTEAFILDLARTHEVIVPDHPGFGQSERPAWLRKVDDLVLFYLDFLEALDLRRVPILGAATGGWIAAALAIRDASRVERLVLVGAAGLHIEGLRSGNPLTWGPEERLRRIFVDEELRREWLAERPSEAEKALRARNKATMAAICGDPPFEDPGLAPWLHRIRLPTLIVWGDSDGRIPLPYAEAFHAGIPGSRLHVIPRCGHLPQVERREEFVRVVSAFLAEAEPR